MHKLVNNSYRLGNGAGSDRRHVQPKDNIVKEDGMKVDEDIKYDSTTLVPCNRCDFFQILANQTQHELKKSSIEIENLQKQIDILTQRLHCFEKIPVDPITTHRSLPSLQIVNHPNFNENFGKHPRIGKDFPIEFKPTSSKANSIVFESNQKSDTELMEELFHVLLKTGRSLHDTDLKRITKECVILVSETGVKTPISILDLECNFSPPNHDDLQSFVVITDDEIKKSRSVLKQITLAKSRGLNWFSFVDSSKQAINSETRNNNVGMSSITKIHPIKILQKVFKNDKGNKNSEDLSKSSSNPVTDTTAINPLKSMTNRYLTKFLGDNSVNSSVPTNIVNLSKVNPVQNNDEFKNGMSVWKCCEYCKEVYEESIAVECQLHALESHCIVCHMPVSPEDRERHINFHDCIESL